MMRRGAWICALLWWALVMALGPAALAQEEPEGLVGEVPRREGGEVRGKEDTEFGEPRDAVNPRVVDQRTRDYVESGNKKITVDKIVWEMIDDFIADTRELNIAAISPVAIRRVGLSPNLSPSFGEWTESQLITALNRHTDIRVKRCMACNALRTGVEGDEWVVQLGLISQAELAEEGRRLGVIAFVDAFISYVPGANIVSLNIQIYRAEDGRVIWSETYQSDATTAAILRSGDRVLSRDEARDELVRKIEERPSYGYSAWFGIGYLPYSGPTGGITGISPGIRLYEEFGEDKRYLFGIFAEGFLNFASNPISGAFVGATMQYQLNEPNLNDVMMRTGGSVAGFIAGTEGNSFALEANFDVIMQFRLGAGVSVLYFVPTPFAGADLGGLGAKARVTFNF